MFESHRMLVVKLLIKLNLILSYIKLIQQLTDLLHLPTDFKFCPLFYVHV